MKLSRIMFVYVMVCSFNLFGMRTKQMSSYLIKYDDSHYESSDEGSNYTDYDLRNDFYLTKVPQSDNQNKGYYDSGYFNYLKTKPFKQRSRDAAQWIAACPTVVEIGGGLNPISKYAKNPHIIVIDPEIEPCVKTTRTQNIHHIKCCLGQWDGQHVLANKKYAVVFLGLGIKMVEQEWQKLFDLINNSSQTVIELSTTCNAAKKQLKRIKKNSSKKVVETKEYDFSGPKDLHYFKDCKQVNPKRAMLLFQ